MIPNRKSARPGEGRTSFTLEEEQARDLRELSVLYARHMRISRMFLKDAFTVAIENELLRMKALFKQKDKEKA